MNEILTHPVLGPLNFKQPEGFLFGQDVLLAGQLLCGLLVALSLKTQLWQMESGIITLGCAFDFFGEMHNTVFGPVSEKKCLEWPQFGDDVCHTRFSFRSGLIVMTRFSRKKDFHPKPDICRNCTIHCIHCIS